MLILPAILESSEEEFYERLRSVPGARWIHLDLSDGVFTPESTLTSPPDLGQFKELSFEIHLMVERPWEWWRSWVEAGVERVIFHLESFWNVAKRQREFGINNLLNNIIRHKKEVGLALKFETDVLHLEAFAKKLSLVHLMSIQEIGYQGHPFEQGIIEKIRQVRQHYPGLKIAVDGGVNEENIRLLAQEGVDQVAVGSAIFGSAAPERRFQKLQELANG